MTDKVLRTRRIPNEDRLEAIIALLRAEVKAWRDSRAIINSEGRRQVVNEAMEAVNETNALGDDNEEEQQNS